jgi:hypothetical protein
LPGLKAGTGFGQELEADDFLNVIIMSGLEVRLRQAYFLEEF